MRTLEGDCMDFFSQWYLSTLLQLINNHNRITESCVIRIDQGRELLKQQQQQQPINVSQNHDRCVV